MPPSGSVPTTTRSSASTRSRKYYYYPGWWEGGPALHNFVNIDKWNSLPPAYKSIIKTASSLANETMQARYDALNPGALKQLIAGGAELRPFSPADSGGLSQGGQRGLCRDRRPRTPTSRRSTTEHGRRSAATSISGGRWRSTPSTTSWSAHVTQAPDRHRSQSTTARHLPGRLRAFAQLSGFLAGQGPVAAGRAVAARSLDRRWIDGRRRCPCSA